MPVYVYELLDSGERFEIVQSMKDPALTRHPETGDPVRRVILSPHLGTKHTPGQEKKRLSNESIAKAGFTKYEKDKVTGKYNRVAGNKGPETLER
ncbi:MAG: FmdB family zinc ribbon protein [Kiritimatiellia bacterium]